MLNINEGEEIYMNYLRLSVIETESAKSRNGTSNLCFKIYFFPNELMKNYSSKKFHRQLMFVIYCTEICNLLHVLGKVSTKINTT